MSTYTEYDKAIGSWRANKPLWPGINKRMPTSEAGYTYAVVPCLPNTVCLQTRRSPYTDIRVEQVEQSKAGRTTYSGLEVMKETQGKANPKQVNELLQKKLG